jgi:hypothetical protein
LIRNPPASSAAGSYLFYTDNDLCREMGEVGSWLETANFTSDGVDNCSAYSQDASSYSFQCEQNTLDADSDLEMDFSEDGVNPISNTTNQPASRRPILVPKPPSTKKGGPGSRSPSPTRKILTLLERARPSVRYRQPGNAVVQPDQVINLRKSITEDRGLQVIPKALEVSIFATHGIDHLLYRFTDQICRLTCDKQTQTVSRTSLRACLTNAQSP